MSRDRLGLVVAALADPTRRRIVESLARHDAMCVSEIAADFDSTRQAVTRHLDVLCGAGLIVTEWRGRERLNRLSHDGFDPIVEWLVRYNRFWGARLDVLKGLIERGGDK